MTENVVVVLATLDSKSAEAGFLCDTLADAGVTPLLIDMSLRPHGVEGAGVPGGDLAVAAGTDWKAMAAMDRTEAAKAMVAGGINILLAKCGRREFSGVIALGGANGTSMACDMMRALPPLFPKVMVSTMAATSAVEWYIAESDIVMFPSVGDIQLNRITRTVMEHACWSVAAMVEKGRDRTAPDKLTAPLIGVSSFGGTAGCVDRVTERLAAEGYEIMHFHASGPGGKALEHLARSGELAGVVDVTTHELADLPIGGVFSAGDGRLRAAGKAGLAQVVVPGAIDHANFWVGRVPDEFKDREFFQFNKTNILMRTNADEFEVLGRIMADRLNEAEGPFVVIIPTRGFSEHTKLMTHDIEGKETGPWKQPAVDAVFAQSLRNHLNKGRVEELDLHINEQAFADACVEAFLELMKR
jgi:uncharacterized protein (UPF0261 family)